MVASRQQPGPDDEGERDYSLDLYVTLMLLIAEMLDPIGTAPAMIARAAALTGVLARLVDGRG